MNQFNDDLHEPLSEINVTPFVDILLVLLIIFMITAPIVTKPINVNLPEENIKTNQQLNTNNEYTITINNKGQYLIDTKIINKNQLLNIVSRWSKNSSEESTVYIQADKDIAYGKVTELMALLNNNGFYSISLIIKHK